MGLSSKNNNEQPPEVGFQMLANYLACRKIVAEDKLGKDTVNAQKEEEERMKRLAERSQALSTAPNLKTLLTGKFVCPS